MSDSPVDQPAPEPLAPWQPPEPPRRRGLPPVAIALLVAVVLVGGLAAWFFTRDTTSVLEDAVATCDPSSGATIGDDGNTLTFDHKGEEDILGLDFIDVACILDAVDAPASVLSHMDQTTSLDGRQTESWDGLTIAWSYHPDRGMDGVITVD